jgi:uncharacterized phage-associated protein
MEEKEILKDNIVIDSYYLINLFVNDSKKVTQLQIQKLMYFFEAFYMCIKDTDSLYPCHFNAWAFGPVAIPLYKEYKVFGNADIILSEEKIKQGNEIDSLKKDVLKKIYETFGILSASQLVDITHRKGSPWYNKWMENNQKVVYGDRSYIDKIETKEWFKNNFIVTDE